MPKRLRFVLLAAFALTFSCASLRDNYFLVKNLDDSNKSKALTDQGIDAYNGYLVEQAALDKTETVRSFFKVALRYDPENERAKQYLDKVDNFKSSLVKDKLDQANLILAKANRKDDDNFALLVALRTAIAVDPGNSAATKMLHDSGLVQKSLSSSYLAKSKEAQAKAADPSASDASREAFYLQAYDAAVKASVLDPASPAIGTQKTALTAELDKAFDRRYMAVAGFVAKAKFEDAKAEQSRVNLLGARLDQEHRDRASDSAYKLYFQWAKTLAAKGSVQDADDKVDIAISTKKTDEALSFKKQLAGKSKASNQEAYFSAALPAIDKLIADGDLLAANKRIASASRIVKDKLKLDQLDARRQKIGAALGDLYAKGVTAYQAEDFKTAIAQLTIVVGINADYEQASDYLGKAKAKQKLLDQYSN
jgi:hypothetical protein